MSRIVSLIVGVAAACAWSDARAAIVVHGAAASELPSTYFMALVGVALLGYIINRRR
jgi:hypothetical protein